ncbi:MAG: alpha/beta hydrolase [Proteobacteria bacterium]|nr:alpha/beta hydrolase [Pseudomonadota bacterium]
MKPIEIKARGFTFEGLVDGPENGPLLILLHGLPRNCWEWHHQIPPMAAMGFRVVAPDLRGFCAGARPKGVDAYHIQEYADDVLAIADELGGNDAPFHLMGTSIGATMAWRIAALNPDRVLTLACLNIPHQGAFFEASQKSDANAKDQRERFNYFKESRKEGNERKMFRRMLENQGMPAEETDPYRKALDSDEALEAVYNYYRAIPLWQRDHLPKVPMPTLFIWPPGSGNISRAAAEACANQATGPYRFEILENVHQPILQAAPEKLNEILLEHLAEHGGL